MSGAFSFSGKPEATLLRRPLTECILSNCRIDLRVVPTKANVQHKKSLKVVVIKVCIEHEEECDFIGILSAVPGRHNMSRIPSFFGIIQVLHHEFLIHDIVPCFAVLPAAHRISTSGIEE